MELLPGLPVPTILKYKIDVTTSDQRGAGTDSSVFIELHGMAGKLGPLQLDNATAFEKGQVGAFCMCLYLCITWPGGG